ncbi:MAG: hypothetical protein QXQ23_05960, partial [Sulfolobales archaeon]
MEFSFLDKIPYVNRVRWLFLFFRFVCFFRLLRALDVIRLSRIYKPLKLIKHFATPGSEIYGSLWGGG